MQYPETTSLTPAPADLLDEKGRVGVDLPCRGCGYNVRTLEPTARCPECNTPVSLSCQGNLLRYCEPGYVARVARGAFLVKQATWLGLLTLLLHAVFRFLRSGAASQPAWVLTALFALFAGGVSVAAAFMLVGALWATTPEPGRSHTKRGDRKRLLVRYWVGAAVLLCGMTLCLRTLAAALFGRIEIHLSLAMAGIATGLAFAYLRYLADLAQRIPERRLAGKARVLAQGVLFAGVALGIGVVDSVPGVGAIFGGPPVAGRLAVVFPTTGSCISALARSALVVMLAGASLLHWRTCKLLREQAELARRNWATNVHR